MTRKFTAAALLLVLILIITLACSGDDPTPASETDRTQQELLERIDQQSNEIRDLRGEVEQLRRSDETGQPSTQASGMPPTQATEATQSITATLPPPPEVSTTENICSRSPETQQALLRDLKLSSCKAVTTEEIYRITKNIEPSFGTSPRAGDFLGLVNVPHMKIHVREEAGPAEIPADAFSGMERLKTLRIYVRAETTFREGALQGLPSLTELTIDADATTFMETGSLSGMPSLEKLDIKMRTPGQVMAGALRDLPNLESLQIEGRGENSIELDQTSFVNSPNLKEIKITASGAQVTSDLKNAFKSLDHLEELIISLGEHGKTMTIEVALSPNSPLMKDILNGDRKPNGYRVIPQGAD